MEDSISFLVWAVGGAMIIGGADIEIPVPFAVVMPQMGHHPIADDHQHRHKNHRHQRQQRI